MLLIDEQRDQSATNNGQQQRGISLHCLAFYEIISKIHNKKYIHVKNLFDLAVKEIYM